jgi:hypothetical protein
VGRGLGSTQQAILSVLEASSHNWLTIPQLAEHTSRSPRQVRTAVHALEARGLVVITKGATGWKGRGDYGGGWSCVRPGDDDPDDPRIRTTQHSSGGRKFTAHWIRPGVPVFGLQVWLPAVKARAEEAERRRLDAIFGPERAERKAERDAERAQGIMWIPGFYRRLPRRKAAE